MTIEWFDVEAGSDMGLSQSDETMLIAGIDPPDWIKVPDMPGLPGGPRQVLEAITANCIRQGHDHLARHYVLEGPVQVCICRIAGEALWYKKREESGGADGSPSDSNPDSSQSRTTPEV